VGRQLSLSVSGHRQLVSNPQEKDYPSTPEVSVFGLAAAEKKQLSSLKGSDEWPIRERL
jgi:hypothetical protein